MDQPGQVANPVCGQLNRENNIPLSPCVPENLVSRDGFSLPVPRQPAHLHTLMLNLVAYLRDSSRVPRRRPFMKPPDAIGSVPNLLGHAIAYRWRSLPRVRRHRASKPHGSSKRVRPWQITMDQLIFAALSHTHYWYEVAIACRKYGRVYPLINRHANDPRMILERACRRPEKEALCRRSTDDCQYSRGRKIHYQ